MARTPFASERLTDTAAPVDAAKRFQTAYDIMRSVVQATDLHRLLDGVRMARDVPRIPKDATQLNDVAKTFGRQAGRFSVSAADVLRTGTLRLPEALVGLTGGATTLYTKGLSGAYTRGEEATRKVGEMFVELAHVRESAERRDNDGADVLATLTTTIEGLVPVAEERPPPAWLADHVHKLMDAAAKALLQRSVAHSDLREAADDAARLMYDLASQARLAKLRPPAGPILDQMLTAHAGADDQWGPVLTAGAAERAARRLETLSPAESEQMTRLLNRAQTSHERAYLLKALAANHDMHDVTKFADRIHPFGARPEWLDKHLSPVDSTTTQVGDPDGRAVMGPGGYTWGQRDDDHSVSASARFALVNVDPIEALEETVGYRMPHPDAKPSDGEDFDRRLHEGELRLNEFGRSAGGHPMQGVSPDGAEMLMDAGVGARADVNYTSQQVGQPMDQDMVTSILRSVDRGDPVLLMTSDQVSGIPHTVAVVGHDGKHVQIFDPRGGFLTWMPVTDLSLGPMTLSTGALPRRPETVVMPDNP